MAKVGSELGCDEFYPNCIPTGDVPKFCRLVYSYVYPETGAGFIKATNTGHQKWLRNSHFLQVQGNFGLGWVAIGCDGPRLQAFGSVLERI